MAEMENIWNISTTNPSWKYLGAGRYGGDGDYYKGGRNGQGGGE